VKVQCYMYITVSLGIVSEHTALGCHWLVAGVDCALLGQFSHTPPVRSLGATCRSSHYMISELVSIVQFTNTIMLTITVNPITNCIAGMNVSSVDSGKQLSH